MKLQLEIIEVENGYVVFDGLAMSNTGVDRKKYVASTVYQLLEVVKGLAEKALKSPQGEEMEKLRAEALRLRRALEEILECCPDGKECLKSKKASCLIHEHIIAREALAAVRVDKAEK